MANPTGKGGFQKGQSGNAGGRTAEQVAAAKALNDALGTAEMRKLGLDAYKALLEERNPVIVKDFMDRVGGRAVERVELCSMESHEGKTEEQICEEVGASMRGKPEAIAALLRGAGLGALVPKLKGRNAH